ncbi:MAG: hypothetical protein K6E29_01130 [Cyanobacteria bacterium RUI128]|nr:hypothetical protein [Cyanobacteria bacterium RUI128]
MNNEQLNESEICKNLKEKLKKIWDDSEFIRGVSDTLKTDENRMKMEILLDKGLIDKSKIVLLSLAIQKGLA